MEEEGIGKWGAGRAKVCECREVENLGNYARQRMSVSHTTWYHALNEESFLNIFNN